MHLDQTAQRLPDQLDAPTEGHAEVAQQRCDRAAAHQRHREEDLIVLVDPAGGRNHVRMVDMTRRLTHEAQ